MPIYRQIHDNEMYVPDSDTGTHNTSYNRAGTLIADRVTDPESPSSFTQLRRIVRPDLFGDTIKYANLISNTYGNIISDVAVEYVEETPVLNNLPAYNRDLARRHARCIYVGNLMVSEQAVDDTLVGSLAVCNLTFGYPVVGNGVDDLPADVDNFVDWIYGPEAENESNDFAFLDGVSVDLSFRPYGANGDFCLQLSTPILFGDVQIVIDRIICCPYSGDPAGSTGPSRIGKVIHVGLFMGYEEARNVFHYAMYINGEKLREGEFVHPSVQKSRLKGSIGVANFGVNHNIASCIAFDVNETDSSRSYNADDYAMPDAMAFHKVAPSFIADRTTPDVVESGDEVTPFNTPYRVFDKFYLTSYDPFPAAANDSETRKLVDVRVWARPLNNSGSLLSVGDYIDLTLSADISKADTPLSLDALDPTKEVKRIGLPAFGATLNDGQYYPMCSYGGQRNWDANTRSPSLLHFHPNCYTAQYVDLGSGGDDPNKTRVTFSMRYVGFGTHVQVPASILYTTGFISTKMELDDIFTCPFVTGTPVVREDVRFDSGNLAKILEGIRSASRLRGSKATQVYNGVIDAVRNVLFQYIDKGGGFGSSYLSTIIDADNHRIFNATGSSDPTVTSSIAKVKP